jgi:hypothetical protein
MQVAERGRRTRKWSPPHLLPAVCRELMNRINYGHESGVIIDVCRELGIWFDADALACILAWLRAGGGRKAARDIPRFQPPERSSSPSPFISSPPQTFLGALVELILGACQEYH